MKRSMTVGISSVFFLAISSFPAQAELVRIGESYRDGIIMYMYFMDNKQHHKPHIHAKYQNS
jgi:hypothetical protein